MRWLYYIPHLWEEQDGTPRLKSSWEDVYLMPDNPECKESIWLTVDGYQAEDIKPFSDHDYIEEKTWFDKGEFEIFKKQGFLIRKDRNDMIVKDYEFTKDELIGWAKLFLLEIGMSVSEMIAAPEKRFTGSNQHACAVGSAKEMMEEYKKDPEGHSKSIEELFND